MWTKYIFEEKLEDTILNNLLIKIVTYKNTNVPKILNLNKNLLNIFSQWFITIYYKYLEIKL